MEKIIEVKGCEDCHFYRFDENGIYFKSFCRLELKKMRIRMIQKFRKKPVEIEAIQWNGNSNKQEIDSFVGRTLNTELESDRQIQLMLS